MYPFLSQETLELNADTFQKHMQSLIESKLLLAGSEQLEESTEIKLNLDYSNKRTKFKITAALQRETPQEVEHTMSAVDEDRKLYLQAAIVRIMKSRKILKHNALIQEVCNFSLSFQLSNIVSLIDFVRKYLKKNQLFFELINVPAFSTDSFSIESHICPNHFNDKKMHRITD